MSWAGQRSASITMPSSLWQLAGWKKGDTFLELVVIDAVQKCLFSSKAWIFYQAIMAWNRQKIGFPRCSQILLSSHYAAENECSDNPRHLCSHLSTHIRITKGVCMGESSFAYFCPFNMQEEERGKHTTKGINICCAASFSIFISLSDFQGLQIPAHEIYFTSYQHLLGLMTIFNVNMNMAGSHI